MCVTLKRGVLSATRGPSCRLLAYPRILLGASHTWVAHSSWALHIQIAVMNIIREEHRDDVRGTLSLTHTHKQTQIHTHAHTHFWSYVSVQTHVTPHRNVYIYCHACKTLLCMTHTHTQPFHTNTFPLTCITRFLPAHKHGGKGAHTYCDVRHLIIAP